MGQVDVTGHHGKMRQEGAAQATRERTAWTVKGPFGAAVATLARMQWTILEHDLALWCMHDGRSVDPRRVCPHSMRILLNNVARVWRCMRTTKASAVNQRGRSATEASTSVWADLWSDVWCEIDVWGGLGENLSVRKVKEHTTHHGR